MTGHYSPEMNIRDVSKDIIYWLTFDLKGSMKKETVLTVLSDKIKEQKVKPTDIDEA